MGAPLDQPFLVQAVDHAHQRDRLDVEIARRDRLADTWVARDVKQQRGLEAGNRQPGLPHAALEPAA